MAYLVDHTPSASVKQKSFNAIRRTKDGMLYLTSVNPNKGNETIEVSKFFEDGKSDFVGRSETDYVDERLEMFDVNYFTTDGSAYQFTVGTPVLNESRIAVFLDGVQQVPFSDFTLVNNTVITFTNNKNNTFTYDHDEIYSTFQQKFEEMQCFQQYKSYTNSNTVPKFCRELSEIS